MVYAKNLRLVEILQKLAIQFPCALKISPERFLDDDAHPAFLFRFSESVLAQFLDGLRIKSGRDRKIEEAIALRAALFINLIEKFRELVVVGWIVDVCGQVIKTLRERVPDLFFNALGFGELYNRFLHARTKLVGGH